MSDYSEPHAAHQLTRMSMPNLAGSEHFLDLVAAYGGARAVARDFRIAPELIEVWSAPGANPPKTALLALWFFGPDGMRQAFTEAHWTHQWNSWRATVAERRVTDLEYVIGRAASMLGHDHPALELPPPAEPLPEPYRPGRAGTGDDVPKLKLEPTPRARLKLAPRDSPPELPQLDLWNGGDDSDLDDFEESQRFGN